MNVKNPAATPLARPLRLFLWLSLTVLVVGLGTAVALAQANTKPGDQPKSKIRPFETRVPMTGFVPLRPPTPPSEARASLPPRSQIEPRVREQSMTWEPYRDPDTGETKFRQARNIRSGQVLTPRGVPIRADSENPKIAKQISSIKAMSDDDDNREEAITKLRQLLDLEFVKRHDRQADEIVKVEERLEKLTREHEKRGVNKDKIVQRRIDSLLDQPDELAWNPQPETRAPNGTRAELKTGESLPPRPSAFDSLSAPPRSDQPRVRSNGLQMNRGANGPMPPKSPPVAGEFAPPTSVRDSTPRSRGRPEASVSTPRGGTWPDAPEMPQRAWNPPARQNLSRSDDQEYDRGFSFPASQPTGSTLREVFQLVRDASTANSDSKIANAETDRARELRKKGVITHGEMQRKELKSDKLAREIELYKKQIEMMRWQLTNEEKYAEAAIRTAEMKFKVHKSRNENGTEDSGPFLEAERELSKARKRVSEAEYMLDQFNKVMKDLLNEFTTERFETEVEDDRDINDVVEEDQDESTDVEAIEEEEISQPTPEF